MNYTLTVTHRRTETQECKAWDYVCGQAIREALEGAESVVLTDINGAQYNIYANEREDNS